MMHEHPSTTSPDLAQMVARFFQRPTPVTRVQHVPATAASAQLVTCPTQIDIDDPVTQEACAALAMAAHAMASVLERETGRPTTAREGYAAAQQVLSAYLLTYRRVASRSESTTTSRDGKVD